MDWDKAEKAATSVVGHHVSRQALEAAMAALGTPSPQTNLAALEKEIKDLKHDLASAEGRAKNATSNCDYWKGQYEALANGSPPPETMAIVEDIDSRTGRPYGDHGTGAQAIDFALNYERSGEIHAFLKNWMEGNLDEWPEFYVWLKGQENV